MKERGQIVPQKKIFKKSSKIPALLGLRLTIIWNWLIDSCTMYIWSEGNKSKYSFKNAIPNISYKPISLSLRPTLKLRQQNMIITFGNCVPITKWDNLLQIWNQSLSSLFLRSNTQKNGKILNRLTNRQRKDMGLKYMAVTSQN